jgi:hypothetical protein
VVVEEAWFSSWISAGIGCLESISIWWEIPGLGSYAGGTADVETVEITAVARNERTVGRSILNVIGQHLKAARWGLRNRRQLEGIENLRNAWS